MATLSADSSRMVINRFICSLVRCGRLPFSPRLSWKRLYGFSLISPQKEGFADVTLESFVIIVDGCLTTFNELACRCVSLFFTNEHIKFIDVSKGYIIECLEFAETLKVEKPQLFDPRGQSFIDPL